MISREIINFNYDLYVLTTAFHEDKTIKIKTIFLFQACQETKESRMGGLREGGVISREITNPESLPFSALACEIYPDEGMYGINYRLPSDEFSTRLNVCNY